MHTAYNGTTIIHFNITFTEGENDTEDLDMNSYVDTDIDLDTDEEESFEVEEVQHVEEVWETENRADLNDDVDGIVDVANEVDAFDTSDNHAQNETEPKAIVLWITRFLLALQRKHFLPNAMLAMLLKFLHVLFIVLGHATSSDLIKQIAADFPSSPHKLIGKKKDTFAKYVTCPNPKCMAVYAYKDCVNKVGRDNRTSKLCESRIGRKKCGSVLLKTVELASGTKLLYPFKIFCYQSVTDTLKNLIKKKEFDDYCEEWRSREFSVDTYNDVYDGKIWQEYQVYNGEPFLACKYSYGLMLNVDWFQPFSHVQYSVGAVYIAIMNLPRHLRYRRENMILCGIIPGPHEPAGSMNQFWKPLVDDLLELWEGIVLTNGRLMRAALLCVACDLPAGRKACGFLGHSATLGCSRCRKKFLGPVGSKDYSGFNRGMWPLRNDKEHRSDVKKTTCCKTITDRKEKQRELGVRYSELLRLEYFDPVRMLIIDPMHCLYLGIAKYFTKNILIGSEILSRDVLDRLQVVVNECCTPPGLGRMPHKVSSSFAGFTAEQFKNWTNVLSLIAYSQILPTQHLECWRTFVLASRILSKKTINKNDILTGDVLLLQFFKRVEQLYGKKYITPNMHMSCHLKDCMLDYGPMHGFWLFSYERMNGILQNQPNNNRSVEVQLMRRFFNDLVVIKINETYKKYMYIMIGLNKFKATQHLSRKNFYLAKWDESLFGKYVDTSDDACLVQTATHDPFKRAVVIHYIAEHTININGKIFKQTVARVSWPKRHTNFFNYGRPVHCYFYSDCYKDCFVPVNFLSEQCVYLQRDGNDGKHLLVLPLH